MGRVENEEKIRFTLVRSDPGSIYSNPRGDTSSNTKGRKVLFKNIDHGLPWCGLWQGVLLLVGLNVKMHLVFVAFRRRKCRCRLVPVGHPRRQPDANCPK